MTTRGRFCSPGADNKRGGESCYTRKQLQLIARAYNAQYSDSIPLTGTKEQLWTAIEGKMQKCDSEWCWIDQVRAYRGELETAFRPKRPEGGRLQWLSTSDIRDVLKQYEAIYPDFVFLGPVPIDFCSLAGNEVCNISIGNSLRNKKHRIGIVFNTDPSTESGKHWISMFIDMSPRDPRDWTIEYFDSFGEAPLPQEVRFLIQKLRQQHPDFQLRLNCRDKECTNTIRHQLDNTECGVYSINFIVERLTGKSWKEQVVEQTHRDPEMEVLRDVYFRPVRGTKHKY